jgi:hypothetical protein
VYSQQRSKMPGPDDGDIQVAVMVADVPQIKAYIASGERPFQVIKHRLAVQCVCSR